MHAEPVPAIDEGVAPHKLWRKGLIIIRLIAEIELRYTSLGNDAAVVCLSLGSVVCSGCIVVVWHGHVPHVHNIVVSLLSFRPHIALLLCDGTRNSARRLGLRLGFRRHGRGAGWPKSYCIASGVFNTKSKAGQNKPKMVMGFRQEQAGLTPIPATGRCDRTCSYELVRRASITSQELMLFASL
jgi:hypothetical protein